ncbi:MAG TPA: hypothetical protein VGT40_05115 [Methylomirabilota bacterium]|nr:hypothetical protein [Methylomirabilota bacterium]
MSVAQYNSLKARGLALAYAAQLLQFYEQVYYCLPWMDVVKNGIGFRQPKGVQADDRYLTVWVIIDQSDDAGFGALAAERRVSAMFSRYGVDLLRRMSRVAGVASDGNVQGFGVVLSWLKPGSASSKQPVNETLALFIDKSSVADFLAKRLPQVEFVRRARFAVFDGTEELGRLPLEVWEDTFNVTFKLKGYEPPKGKC